MKINTDDGIILRTCAAFGVDGVIIATPDFWHVPVLLDAIKAGKDTYVEKPLAWSLDEAKAARNAVLASDRTIRQPQRTQSPRGQPDIWHGLSSMIASSHTVGLPGQQIGSIDIRWTALCTSERRKDVEGEPKINLRT